MKKDLDKYIARIKPIGSFFKRYVVAITIVIIVGIFGFLVWRIGTLANAEPSGNALDDALTTVKRPSIDPATIKALQDLQGQNVDIQSLFPTSRDNPFQE